MINPYHASLLHAEISTETRTCCNSSRLHLLIFQLPVMVEQCFNFLNRLTVVNKSYCVVVVFVEAVVVVVALVVVIMESTLLFFMVLFIVQHGGGC